MDAFFASVEEANNPALKGVPMAVVGRNENGVISCANYVARKMGVKSAMPVFKAKTICPKITLVQGNMAVYKSFSDKVMATLSSFSPCFYQMSIDEGWLDMDGMGSMYKSARECASAIQSKILTDFNVTCSIGVSYDLVVSKMASDYHKPFGITIVPRNREIEFIDKCGINSLWGIGNSTRELFKSLSIDSMERLRSFELKELQEIFGVSRGEYIYECSRGIAGVKKRDQLEKRKNHSISIERTFDENLINVNAIHKKIDEFCTKIFFQCLDEKLRARSISIKIKYAYDKFVSAQTSVNNFISSSKEASNLAKALFDKKHTGESVRLIGIEFSQFISEKEAVSLLDFIEDDINTRVGKIDKISNEFSKSGVNFTRGAIYNF